LLSLLLLIFLQRLRHWGDSIHIIDSSVMMMLMFAILYLIIFSFKYFINQGL